MAANYTNGGTGKARLANARGVKLDFLLSLQDTTTRGHPKIKCVITFLQFVQTQVFENYPNANKWVHDLPTLQAACRVDLPSTLQEIERFVEGAADLQVIHT
jgi:hypothetical protein